MLVFLYGGSSSGKSALAESFLTRLEASRKIYIATMEPFGEEDLDKISRHRKMRLGKGFETIEQYTKLENVSIPVGSAVLLECLANLTANEMFSPDSGDPQKTVLRGLESLRRKAEHLIVVSCEVCSDGTQYPPQTQNYQQLLAGLNSRLAAESDICIETVCSVPLILKGKDLCISLGL